MDNMSEAAFDTSNENFERLEDAVMSTPRGRWFLREFAKRNRVVESESVLEKLSEFQDKILGSQSDMRIEVLQSELKEMASSIADTRADIAKLQSDDAAADHIEAAAGELDAVVAATESATSSILAAAEEMQLISEQLRDANVDGDLCDAIELHTTDIFMACSFQDLTGQRITKVVNTLTFLEQRVNMMIEVWGGDAMGGEKKNKLKSTLPSDDRPDADILDGPATDGNGFSQDEIDAMLDGDFSNVEKSDLEAAEERVASVEARVDAAAQNRQARDAAPVASEVSDPEVSAEADEAEGENEVIDQDDIDSLFG